MNNISANILVVDDEKGLRTGVKRLLEAEGFSVDIAENGSTGIRLGTEKEYDIAIIDLKMPDVDGLQVLKEIKKVYSNTIFLISTAYSSYENAIESIKYGAFSYIPKPFTSTELLERINEAFERRKILLESEKWKKEREESLLDIAFEKTRLNTIINSMAEGVLVVNRSGQVVLYNPNALKFLQLDKVKIEEYIVDKLHPDLSELINRILPLQPSDDKQVEQKTLSKEIIINPEFVIEISASPVPHPDGSLAGVVVLMKNITESKKIETLKSQFVSMVSHELKAPIAAVYGYLQLLSDASVKLADDQRRNFISRSKIRLDGLLKLVNDLLDISRMETKQRELRDYDISQSVKYALDTFQNEIKNKELHINLNIEKDIPLFKSDEDEINRIFTNLISNAIKYNKINGDINISICSDPHNIIIQVEDNGIGMKDKEQDKLFQEFYRAKNEFTKNISGTGLGLSIVKKIIDSYSGRMEVQSHWGSGTSIKICLPR